MRGSNTNVRIISIVVLVTMLVGWVLSPSLGAELGPESHQTESNSSTLYTPHGLILINGDDDFIDQGWPGSGTEEIPFVIEGLNISDTEECVIIRNTRVFFEIRNCFIFSRGWYVGASVELENVTHATIKNCIVDSYESGIHFMNVNSSYVLDNTVVQAGCAYDFEYINDCEIINNHAEGVNKAFWNWGYGFEIYYSSNCLIMNNTADDLWYMLAFTLAYSDHCELRDNTVLDADDYGIAVYDVDDSLVENNTVEQSGQAFWVYAADSCTITRNTMSDNEGGFHLESSRNLTVANNVGFGNSMGWWMENSRNCTLLDNEFDHGLFMEGSGLSHWLHDISSNVIDGKPLGYFVNESGLAIEASSYAQVILVNSSMTTIANGRISSGAIELAFCKDCTVENITIHSSDYNSFHLERSDRCTLSGNRAVNAGFDGFHLSYSRNCTLTNNILAESEGHGFYIYASSGGLISSNFVVGPDWSFLLRSSGNSNLTNNRAYRGMFGYDLQSSHNCTLFNNTALDYSENGVRLISTMYTLVYLNRFAYNDVSADDLGTQNLWDNGTHGNYWSDYGGEGTYAVPGSAGSVDEHPFVLISDPPKIDNPPDIECYFGSSDNHIVWQPQADYPNTYRVYLDYLSYSITWKSGTWNGSAIVVDFGNFAPGTYNFTLLVTDYEGRSAIDTVFATVIERPSTTVTTTTTIPITTTTSSPISGTTSPTTTDAPTGPGDINPSMILVISIIGAIVILLLLGQARKWVR